ncbi:MAG: hydrogenase maturation protease [Thermoplasmatales archaeon]|nr:MAG: hydrogenase maturation protease [Thermoplasmatales archaeon]
MKKIGVVGVGNPLRKDDGVGIYLLNFLIDKKDGLSKNLLFFDGGTKGMNLLHILAKLDVAIIIDAVNLDEKPGCYKFFKYSDVKSKNEFTYFNSHEDDLLKIIALSEILDEKPEIYFFGVQPKDISYGEGFSKDLENSMDEIKNQLINKLNVIVNEL